MKKFNHQNIVQLFDVLETINNKYIVTEYCNGPDLR
jgi:serine/threonine protein kinase